MIIRREESLKDLGVDPVRRLNGHGRPAPHLSLRFDSHLFSIDTSRSPKGCEQPDAYLITHAHSDHYGRSAMLSPRAIASRETARALEIRYGRRYMGKTFSVGKTIDVNGVAVRTVSTRHTIGSCAFFWETSSGSRVLVTGDVKDYRELPRCDLLVTEANYGDPWDSSCVFNDDIAGFWDAFFAGAAFGAYAFGKAQRAVSLIRGMGYRGEIGMDPESLALTKELMPEVSGPLVDYRESAATTVVKPWKLSDVSANEKYVLTGRHASPYQNIRLSDHLDYRGLMRLIEHVQPESVIAYHPEGSRSRMMAHHLRQLGMDAVSVDEVSMVIKK